MNKKMSEAAKQYIVNHPNSNPSIEFPEWDGADVYDAFEEGAKWQREEAIETLSSILENWVYSGDADCIIAEFEERLTLKIKK